MNLLTLTLLAIRPVAALVGDRFYPMVAPAGVRTPRSLGRLRSATVLFQLGVGVAVVSVSRHRRLVFVVEEPAKLEIVAAELEPDVGQIEEEESLAVANAWVGEFDAEEVSHEEAEAGKEHCHG